MERSSIRGFCTPGIGRLGRNGSLKDEGGDSFVPTFIRSDSDARSPPDCRFARLRHAQLHPQSAAIGANFPRGLQVKLTLEINSLTRRLNPWRNVNLRLNPPK